ncbi:hypothetical protein AO1008_09929 [Aspergillus oryzae 100-8]|uniref:Neutral protease 2 n=1 Tax=Aspergillus oryzae (strain 3.042) TaxID=1160506 RepID=I8U8J8_ASPO3|nr:hypothetical protein Ao3042_11670 [Aspergillus oryzae 3.042]KDE83440.1 hypothetical protein AO1008_09929 [Aspergillus oryzae 100-8]|eukprot:EIT83063.1 hypothetical protein Ao3042_11670 [Aspergillus oryzae 3.042]
MRHHETNLLPLTLTSLTTASTLKQPAVFVECDTSESQMAQAAVTSAGEMAAKAAASIRANNVTSLFQTFFKTTDSTSTNHVAEILEEIAQEASQQGGGLATYSCQPDSITCQSGSFTQTGYASKDGYRGQMSTCPAYFQLPQASDDCSVLDQRMSSLHELCHTKGVLGYEVYGYSNMLGLDSQTPLKNAESYAFFSKCRCFSFMCHSSYEYMSFVC